MFIMLKALLLLFRQSAKSLNAKEVSLSTSPLFETWLHQPHTKVEGLHVRQSNVVILTTETPGAVGFWAIVLLCR